MLELFIPNEKEMEALGARLAQASKGGVVIFLQGELGTGKTTLARGFLHALGHRGNVKSPTYTLVEPYTLDGLQIYHFDLYRMVDAEELEFLGARDYFQPDSLCLIEWPERGGERLPVPDIRVGIEYEGEGRRVHIEADTDRGIPILEAVSAAK